MGPRPRRGLRVGSSRRLRLRRAAFGAATSASMSPHRAAALKLINGFGTLQDRTGDSKEVPSHDLVEVSAVRRSVSTRPWIVYDLWVLVEPLLPLLPPWPERLPGAASGAGAGPVVSAEHPVSLALAKSVSSEPGSAPDPVPPAKAGAVAAGRRLRPYERGAMSVLTGLSVRSGASAGSHNAPPPPFRHS